MVSLRKSIKSYQHNENYINEKHYLGIKIMEIAKDFNDTKFVQDWNSLSACLQKELYFGKLYFFKVDSLNKSVHWNVIFTTNLSACSSILTHA